MKTSSGSADGGWLFLLPVGDEDLVGALGLPGCLPFLVPGLLAAVGRGGQAAGAAPGWCSGGELELAALEGDQAGAGEGVVLIAGRQVPDQDGQLPGGRDDRGVIAAAGADALAGGAQRPGR